MGVLGLRQSVLAADGSPLAYPARHGRRDDRARPDGRRPRDAAADDRDVHEVRALRRRAARSTTTAAAGFGGMLTFIDAAPAALGRRHGRAGHERRRPRPRDGRSDRLRHRRGHGRLRRRRRRVLHRHHRAERHRHGDGGRPRPIRPPSPATHSPLASGSHTVYVHGQDGAGELGRRQLRDLRHRLDTTGPATSALVAQPEPLERAP